MVAVPLAPPVQGDQQKVRLRQICQGRTGSIHVEYRLAQRGAHALQHRGLSQEHSLPPGDPRQELRLHVVFYEPVVAAEGGHGGGGEPPSLRFSAGRYRPVAHPSVRRWSSATTSSSKVRFTLRSRDDVSPEVSARSLGPISRILPSAVAGRSAAAGWSGQPSPALSRSAHDLPAPTTPTGIPDCPKRALVQNKHDRQGHRPEGRAEPGDDRTGDRTRRRGQGVEHPIIERLDCIESFRDVGEEDLRIVVTFVDR